MIQCLSTQLFIRLLKQRQPPQLIGIGKDRFWAVYQPNRLAQSFKLGFQFCVFPIGAAHVVDLRRARSNMAWMTIQRRLWACLWTHLLTSHFLMPFAATRNITGNS